MGEQSLSIEASEVGNETVDNHLKVIEIDGKKWSYLEHGNPSGKAILNLHGWLGGSAEGNENLARSFAGEEIDSPGLATLRRNNPEAAENISRHIIGLKGKYRILTPNLPGFGVSEAIENPTLDHIADQINEFQKATNSEGAIVFGSSMGGILAVKLAARYPEDVDSLVLQGVMTKPQDMGRIPYLFARFTTLEPIAGLLKKSRLLKPSYSRIVRSSKDFQLADPEFQRKILSDISQADPDTANQTLKEIGKNIQDQIDQVSCPVVILDGANGEIVPILKSADVASSFHKDQPSSDLPKKKVVFLPIGGPAGEHGHNIVNTFPEGIAGLTDNALEALNSPSELTPQG